MKHAIILAHPKATSLCAGIARAYAQAVQALGQDALVRDLYALDFDPRLRAAELPGADGFSIGTDVERERAEVGDADIFVFVYPFWFNAAPAILKGYVDRVLSMGFGYNFDFGGTSPLLEGRSLISFSTSGAPDKWVQQTDALGTLTAHFDQHLAAVTGLTVLDHIHFGGINSTLEADDARDIFAQVQRSVRRLFKH